MPPPLSVAVTVTVYGPGAEYVCWVTRPVPFTAPRSSLSPSPNVIDTLVIVVSLPDAGVTPIVNVVGVPTSASAPALTVTTGPGLGATTTPVDTVVVPRPLSVAVTVTLYGPGVVYVCWVTRPVPLTSPRSALSPSPNVIDTCVTVVSLPDAGVALIVNVVGIPAAALPPALTVTLGPGLGATTMPVDRVVVPRPLSVAVTVTVYGPGDLYRCWVTRPVPLTAPRLAVFLWPLVGSPNVIDTFVMVVSLPAAGVAPSVKVVGMPTTALAPVLMVTTGPGLDATGGWLGATVTRTVPEVAVTSSPPVSSAEGPAVAVTTAVSLVDRVTRTTPRPSVVPLDGVRLPAVAERLTGMALTGRPAESSTVALIVVDPPPNGRDVGSAVILTFPTAATPTAMLTLLPDRTSPELAVMTAVPEAAPASNVTVTAPSTVSASVGCTDPSVAANVTTVPSSGTPPASENRAVMVAVPLNGRAVAVEETVRLASVGATGEDPQPLASATPKSTVIDVGVIGITGINGLPSLECRAAR